MVVLGRRIRWRDRAKLLLSLFHMMPACIRYVDDCCLARGMLLGVFHPEVMDGVQLHVLQDPFHFIKLIGDATYGKRHPAYCGFMSSLRDAIFAVIDDDKVSHAQMIAGPLLACLWWQPASGLTYGCFVGSCRRS